MPKPNIQAKIIPHLLNAQQHKVVCDSTDLVLNKFQKQQNIVYYRGSLFQGGAWEPQFAFRYGLKERTHSNNIRDYAIFMDAVGISTSKQYSVSLRYAQKQRGDKHKKTYVYFIHYFGNRGVDIDASRVSTLSHIEYRRRKFCGGEERYEVNIAEDLAPRYIHGCEVLQYGQRIQYLENLSFNPYSQRPVGNNSFIFT